MGTCLFGPLLGSGSKAGIWVVDHPTGTAWPTPGSTSCIREVITLPETQVVAEVRKLLSNIKSTSMSSAEARTLATFFASLLLHRPTISAKVCSAFTSTSDQVLQRAIT